MVRIRLSRAGRKKLPIYKVVIADQKSPRDGRFIEIVGQYVPVGEKKFTINQERYDYWIGQGAQPSERVEKLVGSFDRAQD